MRQMNAKNVIELGGKLSRPSKMDVAAWGIPANRCKIGSVLARQEGTTCAECYATTGTFRFGNVKRVMEDNYQKLMDPRAMWTPALAAQIRWLGEERFRWFLSGDLQDVNHLRNIFQICQATRSIVHWLPTRERETVLACQDEIPDNLTIRASATRIDGPPPRWWPLTSTVVSTVDDNTCPSSVHGGSCADNGCNDCWSQMVENVPYLRHT